MLEPPHPVAWVAQAVTSLVNPNNHALDGGPATAQMEKEVVAELKQLFGWPADALGHLTAGGTMANLEALWIARELHPGRGVAFGREAASGGGARLAPLLGRHEGEALGVQLQVHVQSLPGLGPLGGGATGEGLFEVGPQLGLDEILQRVIG
jgi:hypothetical protein